MMKILEILSKTYGKVVISLNVDAFELLIGAVISQNTTRNNAEKAFKRLREKIKITPGNLVKLSMEEIAETIKPAGLHRIKARRIKEISWKVIKDLGGNIEWLGNLNVEAARIILKKLPGVGDKTADVVLSFYFKEPKLAMDTHIIRIAKRLGYNGSSYEEIQSKLEAEIPENLRLDAHILLLQHGQRFCKALNPLCDECIIKEECYNMRISY